MLPGNVVSRILCRIHTTRYPDNPESGMVLRVGEGPFEGLQTPAEDV